MPNFATSFVAFTGTNVVASDLAALQTTGGDGSEFHLTRSGTLGCTFTFAGVTGQQLFSIKVRWSYTRAVALPVITVRYLNTLTGQYVDVGVLTAPPPGQIGQVIFDVIGQGAGAIKDNTVVIQFEQESNGASVGDELKFDYLDIEVSGTGTDPFRAGADNITSTGGPPTETNDYLATHAKGDGVYHQVNIGTDTVNIHYLFPLAIPARLEWVHFCYYFTSSPDGGQMLVEGWNSQKDAWELLGPRLDEVTADTTAQYGLFDGWSKDEGSGLVRFTSLQPGGESITWRLDDLFVSGQPIGALSRQFTAPGSGNVVAPSTTTGDYNLVGTRSDTFHVHTGDGGGTIDSQYSFNIGQTQQADGTFQKNDLAQIVLVFDTTDTTSGENFAGLQAKNYTTGQWQDIEKPFPSYSGFQSRRWGQQPGDFVDVGGDVQLRIFGELANTQTLRVDQLVVLSSAGTVDDGGDGDGEQTDCDLTQILGQALTPGTAQTLASAFSQFFSLVSFTDGKLNVNADCIAGATVDPTAANNFNTYFVNDSATLTTERVGFIDQKLSEAGGGGSGADLNDVIAKLGPFTSTADTPTDSTVFDWMRAVMRSDSALPSDIGGTYNNANHSLESIIARGGPGPWTTPDISGSAIASSQSLTLLDNAVLTNQNLPTAPLVYNAVADSKDQAIVVDLDISNLDGTAIDNLQVRVSMDVVGVEGLDPTSAAVQAAETTQHLQFEMTYRGGASLAISLFSDNANSTAAAVTVTIWRLGGDSVNLGAIAGTPIDESSAGNIANNWSNFWDNGDVIAGLTLSDIGDPLNQPLVEVVPPVAIGSDYTGAQLLYAIRAGILDHELDGALKRLFKTDTVTVNSEYALDDATSPTLIKRSS